MAMPFGNQPVRASTRAIKLGTRCQVVVIEGHGEWRAPHSTFTVPDSVEIVVYQGIGAGMDDTHGVQIGQGQAVPSRLPTQYDGHEYDTDVSGAVRGNTAGLRVYRGGERCPNLTLLAYNEPGYPAITPPQPGSLSAPQGTPRTLRDIANETAHQGCQLRWAACTVIR